MNSLRAELEQGWYSATLPALLLVIVTGIPSSLSFGQEIDGSRAKPSNLGSNKYANVIEPILAANCVSCHGPEESKAMLRIDSLDPTFQGPSAETWHDVLNQVASGEMPPAEQQPIDSESRTELTKWIRDNLDRVARERKGDRNQVVMRRLNRYEYNNTLRDLLGVKLDFARDLPPEPSSVDGFKNNGAALGISPLQIEYYLEAARNALDKVIVQGPAPEVHLHRFEKSTAGSNRDQSLTGNRMLPGGKFFGKMLEYPREGEFAIRVMAGSEVPENMGFPVMQVSLGMRSDTQSPSKVLGISDVGNSESRKQIYEFRGRMEEFPLPGHNPKFPGMTITVSNTYDDGMPPPKVQKYRAITFNSEQKKQIGESTKNNRPKLPFSQDQIKGVPLAEKTTTSIDKLQKQIEELRLISPEHVNRTDLAYRVFDIQAALDQEINALKNLAKMLQEDPDEVVARYRNLNQKSLEMRHQILAAFRGIEHIDRKTKKLVPSEPSGPPRSALVVDYVEFEGPLYETWPPRSHTQLLPKSDGPERNRAKLAIKNFMRRAYRRPVSETDVEPVLAFYDQVRSASPSFEEAMREAFAMILISPEFLYLVEPGSEQNQKLSQYELASRLSYFLWSTMPDEELSRLADSNLLSKERVLEEKVLSMISDSRIERFVKHFTDQWLDLDGLDRVAINPNYYREFDDKLKSSMKDETREFFGELLTQDLNIMNLLDSDFLMLNEPLAKHYGIFNPNGYPKGQVFERVELEPDSVRGGLLTQASFLMINSDGEDSHPIRRAVWILDRLLDDPPAPPPPDVPELNSEQPDFVSLSLKEQLEIHRTKSACNDCHRGIDPWGIAFEAFDAIGLARQQVQRNVGKKTVRSAVDRTTVLPNGTKIDGVQDLKDYLLENEQERLARAIVKNMLAYALGRSLVLEDRLVVEELVVDFRENGFRLSRLIVKIAQSEVFQSK